MIAADAMHRNTTLRREAVDAATVVVGLGKTGLACIRFLTRHGVPVVAMDSRASPPGLEELRAAFPRVPVLLGGFSEPILLAAAGVVVSPGVPVSEPSLRRAAESGIPVVGDIELFAREAHAPVVAVTGSNAKSTVTTLLGEMVRKARKRVRVGGNLGPPALDLLPPPGEPEPDFYVLELSSFQMETTQSLHPAAAVVLNISPDHLDRYPDLASYAAVKQRIYRGGGVMVVNGDDPLVVNMAESGRRVIRFGLTPPGAGHFGLRDHGGEACLAFGDRTLMAVDELRIRGRHNAANALAALALGHAIGLDWEPMLQALREFPGLPHRCEWVTERCGVRWYNDSKGTNVGATLAALEGLGHDGRVVLIAGGDGKGADFRPLRQPVAAYARAVVLIGRDAPVIEAALDHAVPIVGAGDMEDAVAVAARLARPGDSVLLSPACASFDMFRDYEARGEAFVAAVRRMQS